MSNLPVVAPVVWCVKQINIPKARMIILAFGEGAVASGRPRLQDVGMDKQNHAICDMLHAAPTR